MSEFQSVLSNEMTSFLSYYKQKVCERTYHYAELDLQKFDKYLCSISCKDKNITENQVLTWLSSFNVKRDTVVKTVSTLRQLFVHLEGYGYHPFIPPYPKVHDDYIAYTYSDEELKKIFTIVDNGGGASKIYPYGAVELPVILRILYGCGMRVGEVLSLKTDNVNLENGTFILEKTKTREQRYVPMKPTLLTIVKAYCAKMGMVGVKGQYLFPGKTMDSTISIKNLDFTFRNILKAAGIKDETRNKGERGPCLYSFRHVFAQKSFKSGVDAGWAEEDQIPWLSVYLGHSKLTGTEKYLKFGGEESEQYMELFDLYSADIIPEVRGNG